MTSGWGLVRINVRAPEEVVAWPRVLFCSVLFLDRELTLFDLLIPQILQNTQHTHNSKDNFLEGNQKNSKTMLGCISGDGVTELVFRLKLARRQHGLRMELQSYLVRSDRIR